MSITHTSDLFLPTIIEKVIFFMNSTLITSEQMLTLKGNSMNLTGLHIDCSVRGETVYNRLYNAGKKSEESLERARLSSEKESVKGLFKPRICATSIQLAAQKRGRLRADVQKLRGDCDPKLEGTEQNAEEADIMEIDAVSDLLGSKYSTSSNSSNGSSSGSSSPSKKWNLLKNRNNEGSSPSSPGRIYTLIYICRI